MKVKDKLQLDMKGLAEHGPINIVIFGDSVSHGFLLEEVDYENVYWNRLRRMLNSVRDYVPVNMINASIGGTTAHASLARLDRQVLKHEPDLAIVCFGLNDVNGSLEGYIGALREIFSRCAERDVDVIFMTPNMLNTRVADDTPKQHYEYAIKTAEMQNSGRMDEYMLAAVNLAREMGVTLCDCYSDWKRISESEDVTMLLVNRINHPTSEMHEIFARRLFDVIMENSPAPAPRDCAQG